MHRIVRWAPLALIALVAAGVTAPAADANHTCGWSGYSYAGLATHARVGGIAATVSMRDIVHVEGGHVAAWVGVADASDSWLQVGLSAFPDGHSELYYEYKRHGGEDHYVRLVADVRRGEQYRVSVRRAGSRRDAWRVVVNGRVASPLIVLPGSARGWHATATAETWDGGTPVCNRFAYRFGSVRVESGGRWRAPSRSYLIQDPGYVVQRSSRTTFLASSRA
jgi:hypothetical protein